MPNSGTEEQSTEQKVATDLVSTDWKLAIFKQCLTTLSNAGIAGVLLVLVGWWLTTHVADPLVTRTIQYIGNQSEATVEIIKTQQKLIDYQKEHCEILRSVDDSLHSIKDWCRKNGVQQKGDSSVIVANPDTKG